jgi:hypothetical protein
MNRRIYISGAVSDINYAEAQARFSAAQSMLEARGGYVVVNPLELQKWTIKGIGKGIFNDVLHIEHKDSGCRRAVQLGEFWYECMDVCLHELLRCDAIYMLNNWRQSRGARIELAVAVELGLEILMQGVINVI